MSTYARTISLSQETVPTIEEVSQAARENNLDAVVNALSKNGSCKSEHDKSGRSLVYTASRFGHLDILRVLVEANCDVNMQNTSRDLSTPLHGAVWGGHIEVVKSLLEQGAELKENRFSLTPLNEVLIAPPPVSKETKQEIHAILVQRFGS